MSNSIRAIALIALMTGCLTARSAPVAINLDFTTEGAASLISRGGIDVIPVNGLQFSTGVQVFHQSLFSQTAQFSGGLILSTGFGIDVLDSQPAYQFNQLRFDWAPGGQSLEVVVFNSDGTTKGANVSPGTGGAWPLSSVAIDLASGTIDRIEFRSGTGFGVDNLQFSSSTGGVTVPEPAGFGLVALALAAAGLVSKRRRSV